MSDAMWEALNAIVDTGKDTAVKLIIELNGTAYQKRTVIHPRFGTDNAVLTMDALFKSLRDTVEHAANSR